MAPASANVNVENVQAPRAVEQLDNPIPCIVAPNNTPTNENEETEAVLNDQNETEEKTEAIVNDQKIETAVNSQRNQAIVDEQKTEAAANEKKTEPIVNDEKKTDSDCFFRKRRKPWWCHDTRHRASL